MFDQVEDDLERIRNAASQQELMQSFKDFGESVVVLTDQAGRRQQVGTWLYVCGYVCDYVCACVCDYVCTAYI